MKAKELLKIKKLILLLCFLPFNLKAAEVCFTPGDDCAGKVIAEVNKAQKSLLVQAYYFTSAPIASAVLKAHQRGVKVEVILDRSQKTQKYSSVTFFQNAGIETFIDSSHAIAHNKIMIIDDAKVITGSFNFTKAAQEKNAENLLVLSEPDLVKRYKENYRTHKQHSEKGI